MLEKAQTILDTISKLYENEKQVELEKQEKGEFFNVFNTIGLRTEEVRLHSAFIAELLNPKGSHGLSYHFLQAFLEIIDLPNDYIDYHRCSQNIVERVIGPVTDTEGGRIDIIIEDGHHAIIIENKIYAYDQKNQLLRYYNYGRKMFPEGFKLVYLTLDGHEPKTDCLGKNDYEYQILSYKNAIVEWLENCYEIAKAKPLAQTVIKQYCELIKQLTNTDMDTKYKEELLSIMIHPDNVIAVGEILRTQNDWFNEILETYIWKPLEKYALSKEMNFGKDCSYGGEHGAWIYRSVWKHYGIFIWTDRKNDWGNMFIGVSWFEEPNRKSKLYKKDFYQLNCLSNMPNEVWPYGLEFLQNNICYWGYDIIEEIVQGKVFDYIKTKFEEIIAEIDELKLPMP